MFPLSDRLKIRFAHAASSYDDAAVLARATGEQMAARLDYVRLHPNCILDLGCATGDGILALGKRYPTALPLAMDFAYPMLLSLKRRSPGLMRLLGKGPRLVNARAEALPLADGCCDLVWSNLMLQWIDDPRPVFAEMHRVLRTGGLLSFATLGPDTLKEVRAAVKAAGETPMLRSFPDMHDLGDMLVAAGFADPVMDMEPMILTYGTPRRFLSDQRHLGVRDGLLGALPWRSWRRAFAQWTRNAEGRLPASFEIVYGHAWKGESRRSKTADAGAPAIVKFHPRVLRNDGADG